MKNLHVLKTASLSKVNPAANISELPDNLDYLNYITEWSIRMKQLENENALNQEFSKHLDDMDSSFKHFY